MKLLFNTIRFQRIAWLIERHLVVLCSLLVIALCALLFYKNDKKRIYIFLSLLLHTYKSKHENVVKTSVTTKTTHYDFSYYTCTFICNFAIFDNYVQFVDQPARGRCQFAQWTPLLILDILVDFSPGSGSILVFYLNSDYDVVSLTVQLKCKIISSFRCRRSTKVFIVQIDNVCAQVDPRTVTL